MNNPLASKPGDTPVQKKHREQAIVIGTLLLVILTFVLVFRRANSGGGSSSNTGFTPDTSGVNPADTTNSELGAILSSLGALPSQFQALLNGQRQAATPAHKVTPVPKPKRTKPKAKHPAPKRLPHATAQMRGLKPPPVRHFTGLTHPVIVTRRASSKPIPTHH